MVIHLEQDILKCEVKWALGSITANKASGGDRIPAGLFQVLKDDAVEVLHSICQKIWESWQWSQDWKRSVFIPIPKKDNAKECSNYCKIVLISHASKIMLKILQARLQQYINWGFPYIQAVFRKGRGIRDQIANRQRIIEKARKFQKNIYFSFINYAKSFDCVDNNKLENSSRDGHLTCFLRNLYARQEATLRTRHGTVDWFQVGEGVCQGSILSPCLFNLYAEYIVLNAGLDESKCHHRLDGREFGQTAGDSEGQGNMACCSPWGCKELDTAYQLNNNNIYVCVCVISCFSCVQLHATLWILACQAPLSMGFSRQEYWNGLPCPPPVNLPDVGIKPASLLFNLHWQSGLYR